MGRTRYSSNLQTPISRFGTAVHWLLLGLLGFMPLAFGAVQAWSRMIVAIATLAIAVCLALHALPQRGALVFSRACIPLCLFLILVVVQLIPLPVGWVKIVSPNTWSKKVELIVEPSSPAHAAAATTLSFYPRGTKDDLLVVLGAMVVFIAVINVYRTPKQVEHLLAAVTVVGVAVGLLAIARTLFGSRWMMPSTEGSVTGGPFVNRNNFAQFMNLSTGAAIALLLVRAPGGSPSGSLSAGVAFPLKNAPRYGPRFWWLAAAVVVGEGAVLLSLSRGSIIAMLAAITFAALVLGRQRGASIRAWVIMALALAAFGLVLFLALDAIYSRMAALRTEDNVRWQMDKDLARVWREFPVVGTGLGTHEFVFPAYDRSLLSSRATFAENEYAQAAEETGLIGLALVLWFATLVWLDWVQCVRRSSQWTRLIAAGLGFGLVAGMVQSCMDFGMHLPAIAYLAATFCGLIVCLRRLKHPGQSVAPVPTARYQLPAKQWSLLRLGTAGVIVLACAWMVTDATWAYAAESNWDQVQSDAAEMEQAGWANCDDEQYVQLLSHASRATQLQPDNISYRYWLNAYRWNAISRERDAQTGDAVLSDQQVVFARRIAEELKQAIQMCPTYGPVHSLLGQIQWRVLGERSGVDRIRLAARLAPIDPMICYLAGWVDAEEGLWRESLQRFGRGLAEGGDFSEMVRVYVNRVNRPDLALALAGDSDDRLLIVSQVLASGPHAYPKLAADIGERVFTLRRARSERADAPLEVVAWMASQYADRGDRTAAIEDYRRSIAMDYGRADWHLELARLLVRTGDTKEALREARICLHLQPRMQAARELVGDLSTRLQPSGP